MEFYQVHYGGGEWKDSWERVSDLYITHNGANGFIAQLGFIWTVYPNGHSFWEQQEESNGIDYVPHWVRVEILRVVE